MKSPLPVVRVNAARVELTSALQWLTSWGAPQLETIVFDVDVPRARERFAAQGGMASGPFNSQALVREAIAALAADERRLLAQALERVVLVTPPGFHPHVWQPRAGGVALSGNRWVRRYACLPHQSPLGHIAHELGHLLYDWPDLDCVPGLGQICLMARGADRPQGPAAPCAALRAAAGWIEPTAVDVNTRAQDVAGVFSWQSGDLRIIGERSGEILHAARVDQRGVPLIAASVRALPRHTVLGAFGALLSVRSGLSK